MAIFGRKYFWQKIFRMAVFDHFQFVPVFLGKTVGINSECLFLAILNLYQSFSEKLSEKFRMAIFGHSEFVPVFLGKIVRKYLEWPFLAILNLYQTFWVKLSKIIQNSHFCPFQICTSLLDKICQKKFRMAIFGHSKFVPVFLGKIVRKYLEWPFLAILNLYQSFWEKLSENIRNDHF